MRRKRQKQTDTIFPLKATELEQHIKNKFAHHSDEDLVFSIYEHQGKNVAVFALSYVIDTKQLEESLLDPLLSNQNAWTTQSLLNNIPLGSGATTSSLQEVLKELIRGHVFIYVEEASEIVFYPIYQEEKRQVEKAETESVVIGPQSAFTESLETNMNLIRQAVPTTELVFEKIMVGEKIPREVRLVYMQSVANETDINTMRQRISDLEVDEIESATILKQYMEDNTLHIFPQFYITELPDRLSYTLKEGKIGVLTENSSLAFIAPSTFFSFFESMEDIYMRWAAGTALRILRLLAVMITILVTPLYVAVVTYQYELIPTPLLVSLGNSRADVPFPPIIEALFIELMIELLRESGARLPTKVGETMGIVGGIVIGEAAVQAGLTSNILIIIVAASTLASFTTSSYLIGTSFRVIRFPMILLAGIHGIIGIMFGICLLIIHLLRATSLGRPYLAPLYPLKLSDFNEAFFRTPKQWDYRRATMYRPKDRFRFSKRKAMKKRDNDE